MNKKYEMIIGLEVHVELATNSKIFCGCSTEFGGDSNSHTCPVCTGMPGALPVLNKKVVDYALAIGLATHCKINQNCRFDRKNYFYPDNPQNYQISQLYLPICYDGYIEILTPDGNTKKIRIHEMHMEEDASKLTHDTFYNDTLVDCNRSAVPLVEIVSEPDMRSADEVIAYLDALRTRIQYLGVSDCKLQEGSMRADVNLSVRECGSELFGTRTEMKNLNSFSAISRAIESEFYRQIDIIESGDSVVQETRRWNDDIGESFSMRSKEDAKDYRYFPEPDLIEISISNEWLSEIQARQPEFREQKQVRYANDFNLPMYDIDQITSDKHLCDLFEVCISLGADAKEVSNLIIGDLMRLFKKSNTDSSKISFSPKNVVKLIKMIESNTINRSISKRIFENIFYNDVDPEKYAEENNLKLLNDEESIRKTIINIIESNPKSVEDYLKGKTKAISFLIGQTMRATKGRADASIVTEIITEILESKKA